jgi:hypothetical protein
MELYKSKIREIPEPSAYDIWQEKRKLELLEKRELEFAEKLGYNNIAKCIEKEFNTSYKKFKLKYQANPSINQKL